MLQDENLAGERHNVWSKFLSLYNIVNSEEFEKSYGRFERAMTIAEMRGVRDNYNSLWMQSNWLKYSDSQTDYGSFSIGTAMELLKHGYVLSRWGWGNNIVLFRHNDITTEIPSEICTDCDKPNITPQCVLYNIETREMTIWQPKVEDLFEDDWTLVIKRDNEWMNQD